MKIIISIIFASSLAGCLSSKYIPPKNNYATVMGIEHRCENPIMQKDFLIQDGKSIMIYKIDNTFTSLFKPIYETTLTSGTHKIFVNCYLGNKTWRVEKMDSILIDAIEGQTYYLDCSPASISISTTPPIIDFSYQNESEYLRFYDGIWLKSSEVGRLIFHDNVSVSVQGKKINLSPSLLNKKLKGIELRPGHYILNMTYSDGISTGVPVIIEWEALPGHLYKIDVLIDYKLLAGGSWKPIIKDLSQ